MSVNRYLEKHRVAIVFAAQLSISGDPLLPSWEAGKEKKTTTFWKALFQSPEDCLGRAKEKLLSDCLNGLTMEQKDELKKLVPEDLWQSITLYNTEIPDVNEKTNDNNSKEENDSEKFPYEVSEVKKIDSTSSNALKMSELKNQLKIKNSVYSTTMNLINSNAENSRVLASSFAEILSEVPSYWDVDGGIRSMALLGNSFNQKHAQYFIDQVKAFPSSCVPTVVDALMLLLSQRLDESVFEVLLPIILTLFRQPQYYPVERLVENILQALSPETLIERMIQMFESKLTLGKLSKEPVLHHDLSVIASAINEELTCIINLIIVTAYKARYAIIFNPDRASMDIYANEYIHTISVNSKNSSIFNNFIKELFAKYEPVKGVIHFISYQTHLNLIANTLVYSSLEEFQQENLLKDAFANKDTVESVCKWLNVNGLMNKKCAMVFLDVMRTYSNRFWPANGGLEATVYLSRYFNKEFSELMIKIAKDNFYKNKDMAIESLKIIQKNLMSLSENIDEDVKIAIMAYNECIHDEIWKNEKLEPIQIIDAKLNQHQEGPFPADNSCKENVVLNMNSEILKERYSQVVEQLTNPTPAVNLTQGLEIPAIIINKIANPPNDSKHVNLKTKFN